MLDLELRKEMLLRASNARHKRSTALDSSTAAENDMGENAEPKEKRPLIPPAAAGHPAESAGSMANVLLKRDFFGRVINNPRPPSAGKGASNENGSRLTGVAKEEEPRVWVSFHEGYSNAVRKPITLTELLSSF